MSTNEAQKTKIFSNLLAQADSLKEKGNTLFASKEYDAAHSNYTLALRIMVQLDSHVDGDHFLLASQRKIIVSLIGNNALVLYKLGRYPEMLSNCNLVISEKEKYVNCDVTKVWYRRALAREALGQFKEAKVDLEHCIQIFGANDECNLNLKKQKNEIIAVLNRVNDQLQRELDIEKAGECPSCHSQRKIMSVLLKQSSVPRVGEAFYLVEYNWWKQWCLHVKFDDIDAAVKSNLNVVIPRKEDIHDAEEDSGSSSEEDSDDDSCCDGNGRRPGAINNQKLLISCMNPNATDSFFREWRPQESGVLLRPQLVRGYHFECLPRDAYAALKSWYGEICANTTICRRAMLIDESGLPKVSLYSTLPSFCDQQHSRVEYDQYPGKIGLHNLGNTCFMNAALQCLSHAMPLTRYFLTNQFKKDVNKTNPLGTGGKLAGAYNTMIRALWMTKSRQRSISPRALKRAIALFAPRFAGSSQHDSQEFLAFLLDGLHEDLNRVRNPPYIQKADVNHENNLSVAGAEAWDAHCKRNQSIVQDAFYGQFKSTCICPNCKQISVSFDAFNHVSLEIPQLSSFGRIISITMFSATSQSSPPIRYGIVVPKNALLGDVKLELSKLCSVPTERLSICDIYNARIYDIMNDKKNVSDLNNDDIIMAYEIDPCTPLIMHIVVTQMRMDSTEMCPIGYPMLISFSIELSCRQVKEHITNRLSYLSISNTSSIAIRIVDNEGTHLNIFRNSSSIIPDSDEKLSAFMADDCAESFHFVTVEWQENIRMLNVNMEPIIDHPSLNEAVKKHRAMLNRTLTLDQCLDNFTRPERLDEDNKWYCGKCKEHVRAEKTMKIWRLPNILVIHLKRFEFRNSLRREKLQCLVDYPLEGLNMNTYCSSATFLKNNRGECSEEDFVMDDVPSKYDLFGVVNHYGRMGFGHYTACARRWNEFKLEEDWRLFDDSSVRDCMSTADIVSNSGYLLFYRRRVFA